MLQVFCSNAVFVDVRDRRGLGVGAEMMWAKVHQIPVITLAPKDSHYHKSQTMLLDREVKNWVHPFVESLSDAVVENLEEGALWIQKTLFSKTQGIKCLAEIESAMHYYTQKQLHQDHPMKELIETNESLTERLNTLFV